MIIGFFSFSSTVWDWESVTISPQEVRGISIKYLPIKQRVIKSMSIQYLPYTQQVVRSMSIQFLPNTS